MQPSREHRLQPPADGSVLGLANPGGELLWTTFRGALLLAFDPAFDAVIERAETIPVGAQSMRIASQGTT
jgi:hypothetical protein